MPVNLEWHEPHSILVATYSGSLSADDLRQLSAERSTLLEQAPSMVVMVADVEAFEGIMENASGPFGSVLDCSPVANVLLILPPMLQNLVRRASSPGQKRKHRVRFCPDRASALALAVDLLAE